MFLPLAIHSNQKNRLTKRFGNLTTQSGLSRLKVIHANDSKREQGSHVDRHEGIGQGAIGRAGLQTACNSSRNSETIPFILETPKEGADGKPDPKNDIRKHQTTPSS